MFLSLRMHLPGRPRHVGKGWEKRALPVLILQALLDEIAVVCQLANEKIDLLQGKGRLRASLQIAAAEAVFVNPQFERRCASFFDR